MNHRLKVAILGLAIAPLSFIGPAVRACLPHGPRQILDAIDARQGFEGISEASGAHVRSAKVMRFRYWRGPCMLYWVGTGREAGVVHWQMFDAATLEQGRLTLTSADQAETVAMAFADSVAENDRAEAVAAACDLIQSCKQNKR